MEEADSTDAPMTEAQIIAATVGQRKPSNSTIYLAPYNPQWPSHFSQLEQLIRTALGDKVLLLKHVGSTSVPGLAAKPIIDMVLVVADGDDEPAYVVPLEQKGFTLHIRESDGHRLLKAPDIKGNLHVFSVGCSDIEDLLLFRDRLRSHAEDRQLYESTKRELAARVWKYTQNYADAKSAVVQKILARARKAQHSL
ncbi:MAG: hypothetical protein GKR89_09995 [Candidatus Latescibacteria bacterium]|nr:hypothetical protein [Candidatus Latescibacterota bacterium]